MSTNKLEELRDLHYNHTWILQQSEESFIKQILKREDNLECFTSIASWISLDYVKLFPNEWFNNKDFFIEFFFPIDTETDIQEFGFSSRKTKLYDKKILPEMKLRQYNYKHAHDMSFMSRDDINCDRIDYAKNYIGNELKKDRDINLLYYAHRGKLFDRDLNCDMHFFYELNYFYPWVNRYFNYLGSVHPELKRNLSFFNNLVRIHEYYVNDDIYGGNILNYFQFADEELRNNADSVKTIISTNYKTYFFLSKKMKENIKVLEHVKQFENKLIDLKASNNAEFFNDLDYNMKWEEELDILLSKIASMP